MFAMSSTWEAGSRVMLLQGRASRSASGFLVVQGVTAWATG